MNRPNLLYISPTVPNPTGNGLSMRAYRFVEAFALTYRVFLLVVGIRPGRLSIGPPALALCEKAVSVPAEPRKEMRLFFQHLIYKHMPTLFYKYLSMPPEWAYITHRRIERAAAVFRGTDFDVIHAFRLYMVPFAKGFLERTFHGEYQLDLDDIESLTRDGLGKLYRLNGHDRMAVSLAHEAALYESLERELLPAFDRVFVCSEGDREKLIRRCVCKRVEVAPNVVEIRSMRRFPPANKTFCFLFVGTFRYYPNVDALLYFCDTILPILRQKAGESFIVKVVGAGIPEEVTRKVERYPEVTLAGYIDDLGPVYLQCDAVIVPIRAGGGTRIKVLEAFSYQKAVVSTSTGAEGLEIQNERDVLIGDTPGEFAQRCMELMKSRGLREALGEKAFDLVKNRYCPDRLKEILNRSGNCEEVLLLSQNPGNRRIDSP